MICRMVDYFQGFMVWEAKMISWSIFLWYAYSNHLVIAIAKIQ